MKEEQVLTLMNEILRKQGKPEVGSTTQSLREAGFRSLDFSELALRVEIAEGQPMEFDAGQLRQITTVAHVLQYFGLLDRSSESAPEPED